MHDEYRNVQKRKGQKSNETKAFLGAIVKEGGASCSSVTLSKTSSYNASKYNRQDIAKNIKSDFNKPDFLTIHWDGKIIKGDGE